MSKRSDTTGGPKKRDLSALEGRSSYRSRSQEEARIQRLTLIGIGILALVIVALVLGALINDEVVVPTQAITTVNNEEITIRDFNHRVQYERFQLSEQVRTFYNNARRLGNLEEEEAQNQTLSIFFTGQGQGAVDFLTINQELYAQQILERMEGEIITQQRAEELGITAQVDEAAVQAEIDRIASLLTGESLEATPSATPSTEPSSTPTPLVSATPSATPSETPIPSETPQPTAEGCAEGDADCPTVTPLPSPTASNTPTATPETTETATPTNTPITQEESAATVVAYRGDFLQGGEENSGLDEEAIRQVFYNEALRTAMAEFITSQNEGEFADFYVNPEDIWVNVRHILVQFPEGEVVAEGDENDYFLQAQAIVEALAAGEPFAALAQAQSDDAGSGANGGSLGWSSSTGYVEGFKEAVETLPLGQVSAPVRSQFGYHIIQVMDREARAFTPDRLEDLRLQGFEEWLAEERVNARVQRRESWQDFVEYSPDYNDLLGDIMPTFNFSSNTFEE